MPIVQTVNLYQFRQAFVDMGRKENFSYEGLEILFDYLEEYSQNIDENIELDVIGLCCEYSEDSPENIADNYGIPLSEDDDILSQVVDYLNENSIVCGYDEDKNIIVYSEF